MVETEDTKWMARALQLAARGLFSTQPNPRVGCVIVRDGRVVGEGFHARAGEPHAEVLALRAAGDAGRGATVYVTLEPCCHHGRTPPCSEALIAAGVGRVVAAMQDPDPRVAGQGLAQLAAQGIETRAGVLAAAARALNPGFVSRHERGRPYVRVKLGMSLDGRTAMASGESRWITGPAARRDVQKLRARSGAIVTGAGTVLADDPALTVRPQELDLPDGCLPPALQPLRVVLDSGFRVAQQAQVFNGDGDALWLGCAAPSSSSSARGSSVRSVQLPAVDGRVDLAAALAQLAELECNEVLVEAGATLAGAFVLAGLVDELVFYVAPALLGGEARGALELPGLESLQQRVRLEIGDVRQVGGDLRITAYPRKSED